MSYRMQRDVDKVDKFLREENWLALNALDVVWFDEVTELWYRFHPTLGIVIPDPRRVRLKIEPVAVAPPTKAPQQVSLF